MNYRIVEGKDNIKVEEVARLLKMTYWADTRPIEIIESTFQVGAVFG